MKKIPDEEWSRLFSRSENRNDTNDADRKLFLKALEAETPPASVLSPAPEDTASERPERRRLPKKRVFPVDAELDLHEETTEEASSLLDQFLMEARSDHARIIRIITGKGLHSDRKGVLRDHVEIWIRSKGARITWYAMAPRAMGGKGAWIVGLAREGD